MTAELVPGTRSFWPCTRRSPPRSLLVWSLNYLGTMARHDGNVEAAQALYIGASRLAGRSPTYKGIVACLESAAGLAAVRQQPDRAARLCGAAESLRARVGHLRDPFDQADLQATLAAARAALGPEAFAAAWDEGRAMSLDQAVEDASSGATKGRDESHAAPALSHPHPSGRG